MLKASYYSEPKENDRIVIEKLIPDEHVLVQIKAAIDFEKFRELVRDRYSVRMGRSAEDPVRMIKLEILEFLYGLSDREVLKQLQVNVAYRYFLDLSLDSELPTSGLLSQFRQRLGQERHQALFEEVVRQARAMGLVKDRLRIKDATHGIANVAIPTTIQWVAQTRERLLRSARPYAKERVAEEEQQAEEVRKLTADLSDLERLWQRVAHLRRIVEWADELQKSLGTPPGQGLCSANGLMRCWLSRTASWMKVEVQTPKIGFARVSMRMRGAESMGFSMLAMLWISAWMQTARSSRL